MTDTLSPPLVTNTNSFFAPAARSRLHPARLSNSNAFYAPTITSRAFRETSSGRGRRIAYPPRLDLAIIAGPIYLSHTNKRPAILTERMAKDTVIAAAQRAAINSASYGAQTADEGYPTQAPEAPNFTNPFA